MRATEQFFLTDKELKDFRLMPGLRWKRLRTPTDRAITNPAEGVRYVINNEGRFRTEKIPAREVKNWLWMRLNNRSDAEWKKWFALLKECGISGVCSRDR